LSFIKLVDISIDGVSDDCQLSEALFSCGKFRKSDDLTGGIDIASFYLKFGRKAELFHLCLQGTVLVKCSKFLTIFDEISQNLSQRKTNLLVISQIVDHEVVNLLRESLTLSLVICVKNVNDWR
jgi:hypothetical protein